MASEEDDLPGLLPNSRDDDKPKDEPIRLDDDKPKDDEPPRPDGAEGGPAASYDMVPVPEEPKELAEAMHKRSRRRKRDRSIRRDDGPQSPLTLRHGWLDFLFETATLPMTLVLTFFLFPIMVPVAIFAAISAHDREPRKNALVTIGFSLVPILLLCCVCGMASAFRH